MQPPSWLHDRLSASHPQASSVDVAPVPTPSALSDRLRNGQGAAATNKHRLSHDRVDGDTMQSDSVDGEHRFFERRSVGAFGGPPCLVSGGGLLVQQPVLVSSRVFRDSAGHVVETSAGHAETFRRRGVNLPRSEHGSGCGGRRRCNGPAVHRNNGRHLLATTGCRCQPKQSSAPRQAEARCRVPVMAWIARKGGNARVVAGLVVVVGVLAAGCGRSDDTEQVVPADEDTAAENADEVPPPPDSGSEGLSSAQLVDPPPTTSPPPVPTTSLPTTLTVPATSAPTTSAPTTSAPTATQPVDPEPGGDVLGMFSSLFPTTSSDFDAFGSEPEWAADDPQKYFDQLFRWKLTGGEAHNAATAEAVGCIVQAFVFAFNAGRLDQLATGSVQADQTTDFLAETLTETEKQTVAAAAVPCIQTGLRLTLADDQYLDTLADIMGEMSFDASSETVEITQRGVQECFDTIIADTTILEQMALFVLFDASAAEKVISDRSLHLCAESFVLPIMVEVMATETDMDRDVIRCAIEPMLPLLLQQMIDDQDLGQSGTAQLIQGLLDCGVSMEDLMTFSEP